jgi:hypothetical protein
MSENHPNSEEWLTGILEGLVPIGSENLELLQQMRNMQAAYRVLLQHETERLKQAYGEDHPQVLEMQDRLNRNLTLVEKLEAEDQVRQIHVQESGEKESLIHGRVTDESSRGLIGFTVELTDQTGRDLGIAQARVDATGYFAVLIPEEQVDRLASEKTRIYLTIKNRKGEICERRPVYQAVGADVRVSEFVTLSKSQRVGGTAESTGTSPPKKAKAGKK